MNEDREQAFDDFLETRAWDAAQQALFDALRAAFLAGWAAAPCVRQSGRRTGNGSASLRLSSLVQKEEGLREEHGSSRQIARGPRRRVPASDFRQFTCRKSMEFSGSPQKRRFCGGCQGGAVPGAGTETADRERRGGGCE